MSVTRASVSLSNTRHHDWNSQLLIDTFLILIVVMVLGVPKPTKLDTLDPGNLLHVSYASRELLRKYVTGYMPPQLHTLLKSERQGEALAYGPLGQAALRGFQQLGSPVQGLCLLLLPQPPTPAGAARARKLSCSWFWFCRERFTKRGQQIPEAGNPHLQPRYFLLLVLPASFLSTSLRP